MTQLRLDAAFFYAFRMGQSQLDQLRQCIRLSESPKVWATKRVIFVMLHRGNRCTRWAAAGTAWGNSAGQITWGESVLPGLEDSAEP